MATEVKRKESFLLYLSDETIIRRLTDQQAGKWIRYVFEYEQDGSEPSTETDQLIMMAFEVARIHLDADRRKYAEKCEQNSRNIKVRWSKRDTDVYGRIPLNTNDTTEYERIPQNTNGYEPIRTDTNYTDNDNEYEYDNENEYDNEYDSDSLARLGQGSSQSDGQETGSDMKVTAGRLTAEKADQSGNEIPGNEIQSIPALETVQEYARETRSPANPLKFWQWQERNGWKVNGEPIRDWKALFDAWSRKEHPSKKVHNFTQRSNSLTAMVDADGNL